MRPSLFGASDCGKDDLLLERGLTREVREVGAALSAALLVSPLVAIIDKVTVQEITGMRPFASALGDAVLKMFTRPVSFFCGVPFVATVAVYFGTYTAANLSEAALDGVEVTDATTRKSVKVGCATVANVSLLAWRDSLFARLYTTIKPPGPVPILTKSCFATRDAATMFATFYLAPIVGEQLANSGVDAETAQLSASLAIPAVTQLFTAPIHIFAFDIYQRPHMNWNDRVSKIREEFPKVAFARCLRILPAFGIGSYTNKKLRERWIYHTPEDLKS